MVVGLACLYLAAGEPLRHEGRNQLLELNCLQTLNRPSLVVVVVVRARLVTQVYKYMERP